MKSKDKVLMSTKVDIDPGLHSLYPYSALRKPQEDVLRNLRAGGRPFRPTTEQLSILSGLCLVDVRVCTLNPSKVHTLLFP